MLKLLPIFNTIMNSFSALCLLTGFICIKKKNILWHKRLMVSALIFSTIFLISYLYYHYQVGHTVFPRTGTIKTFYLTLLFTHIILAVVMVPFIFRTFYLAFKGDSLRHKKIAKITFPMWLYVSVTGVIVYFFLYHWV
ncbi:MAG: DUF420 domain-containing protein [Bacteriovoracaceae bacterium]|nr:DUF420 domain-containing protein [Bacteriovoracaceae bacterium]